MAVAEARFLRVAHCLALDALAARAVAALEVAGIEAMVLKGPATVHWIYADIPGRRNYSDVDLLVEPKNWQPAVATLRALGIDRCPGRDPGQRGRLLYERPLRAEEGLRIDLHRGFFGVGDPEAFWRELASQNGADPVRRRAARDPRPGVARRLIYALHAAQNGGARATVPKPQHDLERSLELFDEDGLGAALDLARRVGAEAGFVTGLSLAERGGRSSPGSRPDRPTTRWCG